MLVSLQPAGVAVRGIDLAAFDDWVRQEARGEQGLGLVTLFYPMNRVERMERDETVGDLEGFADRFRRETGRHRLEPRRGSVARESAADRADRREERHDQEEIAVLADRPPVRREGRRPRRAVAARPELGPAVRGAG